MRAPIVPAGFLLTTRFLNQLYIDDLDGCAPDQHAHPEHVVFWTVRGPATVEVAGVQHHLNPGQGVWVAAGPPPTACRSSTTTLAALHVLPQSWDGEAATVRSVAVNSALRELLMHLAVTGMPRQQRVRAQRVCLELIADQARPIIELPLPRDERIEPIARAIVRDPADARSIEDWAWALSLSTRTIARAFRAETGMTFSQWRTAARMSSAVRLLGEGRPVRVVARRVGYGTLSAFSAAFHRLMGRSPREFLPTASAHRADAGS
jgi:AraC-like DNA-binding protein